MQYHGYLLCRIKIGSMFWVRKVFKSNSHTPAKLYFIVQIRFHYLTNLSGVKLSYANINGVEISGAVLKDVHMNSSKVVNSKIRNTDMTDANLYNANPTGTKVSGETLKDTVLCKAIMPSG
jgi:hypothetical protein